PSSSPPPLANTVSCSSSGSPYQALNRSNVASRGSNAPPTSGYCCRKSYPPRSVRSWSLYSAASVRNPVSPKPSPFQPDTVNDSPSVPLLLIEEGAGHVAPAGGGLTGTS